MKHIFLKGLVLIYVSCISSCAFAVDMLLPKDFHKAMISDKKDQKKYDDFVKETPHKELFNLIQTLYNEFPINAEKRRSIDPIIPKIIHQIWIGPHAFPKKAVEWQKTWSRLHPDWEYKLWTNEDVKKLKLHNKKWFDKATNWGEKADILRYEILYQFGGLYVDVDFEGLKPFDELHHICDFYTGIHAVPLLFYNKLRVNNGLIAARPGHPIMEQALERLHEFINEPKVSMRTGPDFFTEVIGDILPHSLNNGSVDMVFPSNFFYPSGPFDGPGYVIESGTAYVQPETMGVHYYTAFWINPPKETTTAPKPQPTNAPKPAPKPKPQSTNTPKPLNPKPVPVKPQQQTQAPKPAKPVTPKEQTVPKPRPQNINPKASISSQERVAQYTKPTPHRAQGQSLDAGIMTLIEARDF